MKRVTSDGCGHCGSTDVTYIEKDMKYKCKKCPASSYDSELSLTLQYKRLISVIIEYIRKIGDESTPTWIRIRDGIVVSIIGSLIAALIVAAVTYFLRPTPNQMEEALRIGFGLQK